MLEPGTKRGRYEIEALIGAGGMGQVYVAYDAQLARKVALKILPPDVASDVERLKRFEQEARAASALNHPNILTIYEISLSDDANYLATELVEGMTLREAMGAGDITLERALDVGIQTASALAAAHEAGIVHRDIKPENIMIRRDGLVKVLDFGLAKLAGSASGGIDSEGATRAQVNTAPGVIMGTVQYMPPEQTRGKATDARSDIWSLGCVLYEMAGGTAPFTGETTADIIAEIVKMNPVPLGQLNPAVPERLEEIVSKTLEKSSDERYQSVKDLLIDLRRLKKKIDLESDAEHSHPPDIRTSSDLRTSGAVVGATRSLPAVTAEATQSTLSGGQMLSSGIKRHKFGAAAVAVAAVLLLTVFGYGLYKLLSPPQTPRTATAINTVRLTGDGKTRSPEISPDGKFLAYSRVDGDRRSLWIKQVATNSNIPIVSDTDFRWFDYLAFSPDGSFLYFAAQPKTDEPGSIYRAPTLGGTPTKVISNAGGIQFSPDARQVSYIRWDAATSESFVLVANADGTNERKLATRSGKTFFNSIAAWSPGGKLLAVASGDDELAPKPAMSIQLISVADGATTELGPRWGVVNDMVWHPSGDSLIAVAAAGTTNPQQQLWEIAYPSGDIRRLTNNLNGHSNVSITADGKSIVTGESYARSAVYVSPDLKPENAKAVMQASADTAGFGWTPDGRIVYVGDQTGDTEIWIMNADGSNAKALTNDRITKSLPVVSPDGKYIVYWSADGLGQLVRIDITGGNPLKFDRSIAPDDPDISADSRWILYSAWIDGRPRIARVSIDGGEPQVITDYPADEPRYSNDGTRFACLMLDEKTQLWNRIGIVPADGGQPIKTLPAPGDTATSRGAVWTPDDTGIVLIVSPGELMNLWLQPVDGSPGKAMTNFQLPSVSRRAYSRDGKRIALVRGEGFGNAIMITDYR